ncbi:putative F-box protein At1g32420 [Silene latifolia]|uniref:putative F-box protein At1g32420 n=1 Tax=Silene latifolia TaxID=37657 RepID=UPI003D76A854
MEVIGITSTASMATIPVIQGQNPVEVAQTSLKKKRKWATVGGCFDRLPCEILQNIALMLPFSSIKLLRRSSKFWYNLLTDSKFVNLHLTCSLQKPPGYLFTASYVRSRRKKLNCYFVEESKAHLNTSKIFEYSVGRSFEYLCQSSGGLMCVYSRQSNCFRVCNPHIGEEVQVSGFPKPENWFNIPSWFFGYSPSTNEYKILKLRTRKTSDLPTSLAMGAITTLGSNLWIDIQDVPFPLNIFINRRATECQGNLFWMNGSNLVSFDLVSEKFHEIPGPPRNLADITLDRVSLMTETLVSMSHTLGYVKDERLWVLEDKIKGIWSKRYDFSAPPLHRYHRLTGILENGDVFGHVESTMNVFSHDMGCTGFKVMNIELEKERKGRSSPRYVQCISPHVRSLVSPVRIMENGRKTNPKRKWVLDRLKLGDDATEDDLFNSIYQVLNACDE